MNEAAPALEAASMVRGPGLAAAACAAVAVPTLIAFNVSPSATFFNQAAAFVGWGGFLLALGAMLPRSAWPRSPASLALLLSMVLVGVSALIAPFLAAMPWSLALSSAGTILAALLAVAMGASVSRSGLAEPAFRAICIGLAVAGALSAVVGLVQVFAPQLADGDWIAVAAIPGRATGNLRQPNHLSTLLLWSVVAVVWLGEAKRLDGRIAVALALVFIYVVVLSASRTGALGMLTLAGWALLDRRLSSRSRAVLLIAPLAYAAMWWATSFWASHSHQLFGAEARFSGAGDISTGRFAIWSNTLSLIASHPWLGVGFGDFNFAWTLTPFPDRPIAFFDHSHNIVLNFAVEMGVPLAMVVLTLMAYALWRALGNAISEGREPTTARFPVQRAACVMVVLVAVHSMFEYPLWYSYFLLPAAFAFGLALERPVASEVALTGADSRGNVTRPYVLAAMLLMLGGTLAVYDYMRVVVIFAPPAGAGPLDERIANGRRSVLFAHHADYAAATVAEHPGEAMSAFRRAPHYLLDARLLMAWAKAFDERGESDKARWVAARLKEFRNDLAEEFFAPCRASTAARAGASGGERDGSGSMPFQCLAPARALRFEDFR